MAENKLQKEAGLMKLDKLIAAREYIPGNEFPVPIRELCERYERLYTGAINDVMRERCLLEQNLPSNIMPLRDEMTVCGIAFTVKSAPNVMIQGEMTFRAKMLDEMRPEGVVVWDTSEDTEGSLWGGVMTATAIAKGLRGAVIAGGIRDTKQILEQKFPVFYKYRTSNGSLGRCLITHYQVPVKIGKVTVRPGDVIFGDIDGVLCVPREIAYEVLLRAEEIERNENEIFKWVRGGDSIQQIVDKGGYF
ncbi:MAG: dimethylmenaquinone methyltransferase [Lentisphaerae bacterium RIFOXYB12_FULL_65_16]|nr:MAG: dimethylmenaquinone methyltransferase [Lentisphaerae bacterium RIFOXYA12_64_32]OGV87672.1 MAG: dimethylmenaquinone methyltransferase [Lentisphaerae bacterium RIFOXYB12_FULL_65_16]